ncbi:hypothetical protein [Membranihabitans maritimus]|uniref:hypothetical protein n=1 Tax=Membranihabitans maritimus TaxID=2904244 RepID=UPI001F4525A0|nr:hypothetical protein [Membranihabitans maritimus]
MKKQLKEIRTNPISPVKPGKDIRITQQIKYDLTPLEREKQRGLFKVLNKWVKSRKKNGVIMLKEMGSSPHISLQVNSAANKKNVLSFPEPDLSRIYYRSANYNFEYAINEKNKLLPIGTEEYFSQYDRFVSYIRFLSVGCILTISSLEAFMNSCIPFNFEETIDGESVSKQKAEYLDFNTKITKLMPLLFQKDFVQEFPTKYEALSNCNSLRDDFIHPKTEMNENKTLYEKFLKRAFDANIKAISEAGYDFVNFHIDNYFELITEED